jgi:very-short-patch-repair endonuclease
MTQKEHEHECALRIKAHYSNVNVVLQDTEPYVLYRANDIANALKLSNIRSITRTYDCSEKFCKSTPTKSGNQMVCHLTHKGLEKLAFASRSSESMKMNELLGMAVARKWFPCIELDVITNLLAAFRSENVCRQFACEKYRIDLYFVDYKIAVECDELQHTSESNKTKDEMRETVLKQKLHCEFIRFNPFDPQFNVFELIGKIHSAITEKLKTELRQKCECECECESIRTNRC